MNEYYAEQMIKQRATVPTMVKRAAMISVAVVILAACLMISMALIPLFLAACALAFYLWGGTNLEFEYTYFAGELDIDRIANKQKRKRVFSTNVKEIDIIAPTGAPELKVYDDFKRYDCSSNSRKKTYEMIFEQNGRKVQVVFEPGEDILKDMKRLEPGKVIL